MMTRAKTRGFTLLETLIATSVVAVIAALIAQVFFTTTHVNTKTELLKDVKQNGDFALDVMTRMIRNSLVIISPCDGTSNSLKIQNPDGGMTTFSCQADSGVNRIASSGAFLTSSNVTLGDCATFQFTCTSSPAAPDKITITFQIAQKGTPVSQFEQASIPFQTTVSSRN